ncbi:MAG: hypothetical protein R2827_14370 [Bdellovibrionales bacterium]
MISLLDGSLIEVFYKVDANQTLHPFGVEAKIKWGLVQLTALMGMDLALQLGIYSEFWLKRS